MAGWELAAAVAITGTGAIIGPMQGARLALTTIPAGMGQRVGGLPVYFDLGYVVWLADGRALRPRLLQLADELLTDAPLGVTGLSYSLLPGVSGTLAPAYYVAGIRLDEGLLAPTGADPGQPGWVILA